MVQVCGKAGLGLLREDCFGAVPGGRCSGVFQGKLLSWMVACCVTVLHLVWYVTSVPGAEAASEHLAPIPFRLTSSDKQAVAFLEPSRRGFPALVQIYGALTGDAMWAAAGAYSPVAFLSAQGKELVLVAPASMSSTGPQKSPQVVVWSSGKKIASYTLEDLIGKASSPRGEKRRSPESAASDAAAGADESRVAPSAKTQSRRPKCPQTLRSRS